MSAMTEIPAKMPRPMGRTDSFLPGRVNAACAVDEAAAADAEEAEADAEAAEADAAAALSDEF
jgi:hypothetical protein